jgi:parallel beta-helix repeat protein
VVNVDSCGADPWDSNPDSDAIQDCIDQTSNGDTVLFTSGVNNPDYYGYVIDKTIFLVRTSAKNNLTFRSTDPDDHALLKASPDLLGFVVRLFARSSISDPGNIDNITISHLDLDGNRAARKCFGVDGIQNGNDDNWGSWLPECNVFGDSWCTAGSLGMHGELDWQDPAQDYLANPSRWSTGLVVDDLRILQTECGTALGLTGAASIIRDTTIDTAGEHVHVYGCSLTDDDEGLEAWADGITFAGPGHLVTDNTIINPSDIGITLFGGMNTVISNNTVRATSGNYGMFAAINIGPVTFSDVSGVQVIDNQVINEADESCGGIHVGIDIGPHMWGAGCLDDNRDPALVGNPGVCMADPPNPNGVLCEIGESCQIWAYVAAGRTFTLMDNYVSGAQVNYLIEGLDLVGTLIESGNTSGPPRMTDWAVAKVGCSIGDITDTWGAIDRVAHHPSLDGWVDQRIHCER